MCMRNHLKKGFVMCKTLRILQWFPTSSVSRYHKSHLSKSPLFITKASHCRRFWEYVNMMFNRPDPGRIALVGPDRACAEWVLRNGGTVVWADGKRLTDYNKLPPDDHKMPQLIEIDGSDSSISHYGFSHLHGCHKLKKIILHNDKYIEDRAIKGLCNGKETLLHVQVSKCPSVTDDGIKEIKVLSKLQMLVLFELHSVVNLDDCINYLKLHLPHCTIKGKQETNETSSKLPN